MRRTLFRRTAVAAVSAASLALLVSGCGADATAPDAKGKDKGASAAPEKSAEAPAGKALTSAELDKVLLTQADLATHLVKKGTKADEVELSALKADKPECSPLLEAISSAPLGKPSAHALVKAVQKPDKMKVDPNATDEEKFEAGMGALTQPVTADRVASYDGTGAQDAFAALAKAGKDCAGGFNATQAGEKVKITKVVADPVTGGDEAQGWILTMDMDGEKPMPIRVAAARKGNALASFYTISLGGAVTAQPTGVIEAQLKKLG
ncbi:hypothetical protein [Streptomyces sp. NPDC051561]|uniref:hypothetical protein n=1 Tax=Streptomyces sp. NPDC051561 TaxID=3365658 RepID=UPI00378A43C3